MTVRDVARQTDLRLVPTERYTSAAFARREADALWRQVWQMVCREEDLPNPGDCWTHVIVDQPIVVVRTPASGHCIRSTPTRMMAVARRLGEGPSRRPSRTSQSPPRSRAQRRST